MASRPRNSGLRIAQTHAAAKAQIVRMRGLDAKSQTKFLITVVENVLDEDCGMGSIAR